MGRKSTKENKNIYQISRENLNLTREAAAEQLEYISADRIEKIESEKSIPHPDEILAMADCYKNPSLCNYYCSHECPIGKEYVPEVMAKDLSMITLEMLSTLNTLSKEKDRMIDIAADGKVTEDEISDFLRIKEYLEGMSLTIESFKLWIENTIASGNIDPEFFKKQGFCRNITWLFFLLHRSNETEQTPVYPANDHDESDDRKNDHFPIFLPDSLHDKIDYCQQQCENK